MLTGDLENNTSSYRLAFCKVIESRIMEAAATREHHFHFRATCEKSEEVKCVPPFSFVFTVGNKSAVETRVRKAVRDRVKTF